MSKIYGLIFSEGTLRSISNQLTEYLTCLKTGNMQLLSPMTKEIYRDLSVQEIDDTFLELFTENKIKPTDNFKVMCLTGFNQVTDERVLEAWTGNKDKVKFLLERSKALVAKRKEDEIESKSVSNGDQDLH